MRRLCLWLVGAFVLAACESQETRAFKTLAHEINPLLHQMRPAAARVLTTSENKPEDIIEACWSASEALWSLRNVESADYNDGRDTEKLAHARRLMLTRRSHGRATQEQVHR